MKIVPIAIILVFAYLGYKLNKNYILWGFLGLGILVAPPLLMLSADLFGMDPSFMLSLLPLSVFVSFLLSITIIVWVVYRNKAVFKKDQDIK